MKKNYTHSSVYNYIPVHCFDAIATDTRYPLSIEYFSLFIIIIGNIIGSQKD